YFRLKIGDLQYADLALPLAVTLGNKQAIDFASTNLQVGTEVDASASAAPGETAAPLPSGPKVTGAAPRALISDIPELVEARGSAGRARAGFRADAGLRSDQCGSRRDAGCARASSADQLQRSDRSDTARSERCDAARQPDRPRCFDWPRDAQR